MSGPNSGGNAENYKKRRIEENGGGLFELITYPHIFQQVVPILSVLTCLHAKTDTLLSCSKGDPHLFCSHSSLCHKWHVSIVLQSLIPRPLSDIIPSSSTAIIQPSIPYSNAAITTAGSAQPLLIFSTEPVSIPQTMLQPMSCIPSIYHIIHNYIHHNQINETCKTAPKMECFKMKTTFTVSNPQASAVLAKIPSTIKEYLWCFHLEVHVHELSCWRTLFAMLGKPFDQPLNDHCTNFCFPLDRSAKPRIPCSYPLYKNDPIFANQKNPIQLYQHQRFIDRLAMMLSFWTFEQPLDSSITATHQSEGCITDIWGGTMRCSFKAYGKIFIRNSGNLVFLSCDWLDPYGIWFVISLWESSY